MKEGEEMKGREWDVGLWGYRMGRNWGRRGMGEGGGGELGYGG